MAPQFPPSYDKSRFEARLQLESLLEASARALQPRGKIALLASRSRIPESNSSWGRVDAGVGVAHPRAKAPLTDSGREQCRTFREGISRLIGKSMGCPCTAAFAHEGRQPWPPARAHSPNKLPVALRSSPSIPRPLAAVAGGGCHRPCLRQHVSCYPFAAKRSTTESGILAATCFTPQTGLGILERAS
jgi:hypothetical protein